MVCPCIKLGHLSPQAQLDKLNNALLTDPVWSLIEVDATDKNLDHQEIKKKKETTENGH